VPTNQQTNQIALHLYNPVKKCAKKAPKWKLHYIRNCNSVVKFPYN